MWNPGSLLVTYEAVRKLYAPLSHRPCTEGSSPPSKLTLKRSFQRLSQVKCQTALCLAELRTVVAMSSIISSSIKANSIPTVYRAPFTSCPSPSIPRPLRPQPTWTEREGTQHAGGKTSQARVIREQTGLCTQLCHLPRWGLFPGTPNHSSSGICGRGKRKPLYTGDCLLMGTWVSLPTRSPEESLLVLLHRVLGLAFQNVT